MGRVLLGTFPVMSLMGQVYIFLKEKLILLIQTCNRSINPR